MATTIDVTNLATSPGVRMMTVQVTLDEEEIGCLPYLALSKIEIHAATVNNRASAVKVGETTSRQFIHSNLPAAATTYYYWAKTVNVAGNVGAFYPVSATAGVVGTSTAASSTPGPGSVGNTELADNAVTTTKIANLQVTDAKIGSLSASKLTAGTITATISIQGPTITGGLIRTSSSTERVEMSSSNNSLSAYNPSGSLVARIGSPSSVSPPIVVTNVGPAATLTGSTPAEAVLVSNTGSGPGLWARGIGSTSNNHGIRGVGLTTSSAGGHGIVGVSAPGGGWAFYAQVGSYGPFTGSHDGLILKETEAEIGDILFDIKVLARNGVNDTLTEVGVSDVAGLSSVIGVLAARMPFDPYGQITGLPDSPHADPDEPTFLKKYLASKYDRVIINAVGEGQLNICGRGGDIEAGDLVITSTLRGKGERQSDDILRGKTVARARERVIFDDPDQVKRMACVYVSG